MNDDPTPPEPPCPFDPPCFWCSNPDRWRVVDGDIEVLAEGETWEDR